MTFKPTAWFRIAAVLAVVNLVGAGFAIGQAQLPHAAVHVVLALGFAWWAGWLRQRPGGREVQPGPDAVDALEAVQTLEADARQLRQALAETPERIGFAESQVAPGGQARPQGAPRPDPEAR